MKDTRCYANEVETRYQSTTRVPGERVGVPMESKEEALTLTRQHGGAKVLILQKMSGVWRTIGEVNIVGYTLPA